MKKTICLIMAAVLLLSLCACGGSKEAEAGLKVGFGRADATPTSSVYISGGDSKNRMSAGYRDPINVTCVALGYGADTFLIYTLDYITTDDSYTAAAEAAITEATGVPADRIIMNSTHTHSGPAVAYKYDSILPYRDRFNKAAVTAAEDAIADMAAAEVFAGAVETEGLIFVRHYELENGTFAGANYGSFSSSIKGHAYEGDTQVQVIRFDRGGEKEPVVLISNPAHATAVSGTDRDLLSADIAFSTRDYVEQNGDCLVAYFAGSLGDQVPSSRILEEGSTEDYMVYGQRLGDYVLELLPQLTQQTGGQIKLTTQVFTGNTIKDGLDRLDDAQKVANVASKHGNSAMETKAAVSQYGFSSVYQATAIVARSKRADTQTMELNTLTVGDVAFVFAPYEMFSENGKFIKENSPYEMTFIVCCSEEHQGYLPSENGFRIGCYESHVTVYEAGTAETLAQTYVDMLTAQKGQ